MNIGDFVVIRNNKCKGHENGTNGKIVEIASVYSVGILGLDGDMKGEIMWHSQCEFEVIEPFTRRDEALSFLRGALSRCDQEGVPFVDAVRVVKSWVDTKNITTWEKGTFENIHVGDTVRIESNNRFGNHKLNDIGKAIEVDIDEAPVLVLANGESFWYCVQNLSVLVPAKPSPQTPQPARLKWVAILPDRSNRPEFGDVVKLVKNGELGRVLEVDGDYLGTRLQLSDETDTLEVWFYDYEILVQSKPQSKSKTIRYERLTDESPLPAIGAKVRIEDNADCICDFEHGEIGIVSSHYKDSSMPGVYLRAKPGSEVDAIFWLEELSLVIEE